MGYTMKKFIREGQEHAIYSLKEHKNDLGCGGITFDNLEDTDAMRGD